jgi:hypothetical protein
MRRVYELSKKEVHQALYEYINKREKLNLPGGATIFVESKFQHNDPNCTVYIGTEDGNEKTHS